MTAARLFLGLVAVALWSAAALVGGRALLLEGWRFDLGDLDHWRYLAAGLEAVWSRGASMRWGFLAALAAVLAVWLAGAGAAARGVAAMDDDWITWLGRGALTLLRWAFAPLRLLLGLAGGVLVRIVRRPAIHTIDKRRGAAEPRQGEDSWSADLPLPAEAGFAKAGSDCGAANEPDPPVAPRPTAEPPPLILGGGAATGNDDVESVVVSRDGDRSAGRAAADADAAEESDDSDMFPLRVAAVEPSEAPAGGFTVLDLQAAVNAWLARQGWSVFPDLYVNADAGDAKWERDWFDSDPGAVIALVAGSLAEIHLVMFGDLKGKDWLAAPWDPERQGIASWRAQEAWRSGGPTGTQNDEAGTDQQLDIPCPFGLAIRARQRFLAQHGAYLAGAGYDSVSLIGLVLILTRGGVANFDDVAASWDLTDVSVAALEPAEDGMVDDLPLRSIFGAPPEEQLDPFVIKHLKEGSRAAIKLAGPAAA